MVKQQVLDCFREYKKRWPIVFTAIAFVVSCICVSSMMIHIVVIVLLYLFIHTCPGNVVVYGTEVVKSMQFSVELN